MVRPYVVCGSRWSSACLFWLYAALLRLLPSLPAMLSDMMASAFLQIAVHQARFMLIGETTLEDFGSIMSVLVDRTRPVCRNRWTGPRCSSSWDREALFQSAAVALTRMPRWARTMAAAVYLLGSRLVGICTVNGGCGGYCTGADHGNVDDVLLHCCHQYAGHLFGGNGI